MVCDIHSFAEVRRNNQWRHVGDVFPLTEFERELYGRDFGCNPFRFRHYGLFGWLANVRNYSRVPSLSEPRGLPSDVSAKVRSESDKWGDDGHSHSWLLLSEMLEVDYEQIFWDRRATKQVGPNLWSGAALAEEGEGRYITLREFLQGSGYFAALEVLQTLGPPDDVRVVFWFDN